MPEGKGTWLLTRGQEKTCTGSSPVPSANNKEVDMLDLLFDLRFLTSCLNLCFSLVIFYWIGGVFLLWVRFGHFLFVEEGNAEGISDN